VEVKVHMPVVQLTYRIARQLQLTHFLRKPKPVPRIVERGDIPDALEYPLGLSRLRNPEQITVPDEAAVALRHPAPQRARFPTLRNDALAFRG
jgi:hypothetical protein